MSKNENDESNNLNKKIEINGTSNRYMIKKLTKEKKPPSKRKETEKWKFSDNCLKIEEQLNILKNKDKTKDETEAYNIIIKEIDKKLSGYKQQDKVRKIYDENKIINSSQIIEQLIICNLDCYYCKEKCLLLYELKRENKQWTLDRIDNDIGHNHDNIVISCLECNLKRRRKTQDAFVFTKQLKIVKNTETN